MLNTIDYDCTSSINVFNWQLMLLKVGRCEYWHNNTRVTTFTVAQNSAELPMTGPEVVGEARLLITAVQCRGSFKL